jgi:exopolysaccharide production protein ExoQ
MSGVLPTFFCVAIALLFGGGGSSAPVSELVVEFATALAFAAWVWQRARARGAVVPLGAAILCIVIVFVPLVQLVPLPPSLWHNLPGRDLERQALALIGQADSWRPLSVIPGRTLASLLAMLAAVAVVPMVSVLTREQLGFLLAGITGLALLSALVGVCQMAGITALRFYLPDQSLPVGFQASRNFQAEVLNIGILCAGAASRLILGRRRLADLGVRVVSVNFLCSMLLETAQVLGASRAGLALSVAAFGGQAIFLWPALRSLMKRRLALGGLVLGGLLLAGGLIFAGDAQNAAVRFADADQTRARIWKDTAALGAHYAPVGAGMGTFLPLYEANERLDEVSPYYVGRAHDDYLELMTEAGWTGLAALAVIVMLWGIQVWRMWRTGNDGARTLCVLSVFSLGFVALHSIVDYPLRSMTLAALSAVMVGVVFCREVVSRPGRGGYQSAETKVRE